MASPLFSGITAFQCNAAQWIENWRATEAAFAELQICNRRDCRISIITTPTFWTVGSSPTMKTAALLM